ncbi:Gfo/Idh/MocA family oxidoreductase [Phytomonospora sp. NPDC050363]|uniref:Gfo/Idh/MocA family protein n=1 Tax=Phytomonospora sp. NPDC050363 TaxID=3155642 RepID=UPI0033C334F9
MTGQQRRYAFVGTGHRAQMYLASLLDGHADVGHPVAFCDTNEVRMSYHDRLVAAVRPDLRVGHYAPADFGRMLADERPDTVVITSPDATHAEYVARALEHGADVVVEKPMTTDLAGVRRIQDAVGRSDGELVVTFNYRYSPRNTLVRELIAEGAVGEVTSVNFEWCLDTLHGADYFRRWHRDKATSGGLLVHKSTHHFDLVNWWLDDRPEVVFARGGLFFYGAQNARRRGLENRPERARNVDAGDPFAFDLGADERLRLLYRDGEHLDGYIRDRDVFSEGITIEDNLNVVVGYRRGASMSYTLHAHSPWEGYRVAVNGTEGRIELDVVERGQVRPANASVLDPSADRISGAEAAGSRSQGSRLTLQRHWEPAREIAIGEGRGSHGGGDGMLLDDVFRGPGADPLRRSAGFGDGAASVLVGIAGNESLRTGEAVRLDGLLPPPTATGGR